MIIVIKIIFISMTFFVLFSGQVGTLRVGLVVTKQFTNKNIFFLRVTCYVCVGLLSMVLSFRMPSAYFILQFRGSQSGGICICNISEEKMCFPIPSETRSLRWTHDDVRKKKVSQCLTFWFVITFSSSLLSRDYPTRLTLTIVLLTRILFTLQ